MEQYFDHSVSYLTGLGWLTSLLPSVFYAPPIRMNKNRFEEDDGIDMNDIERFLPHLHSVSQIFGEIKACFSIVLQVIHSLVVEQCPLVT